MLRGAIKGRGGSWVGLFWLLRDNSRVILGGEFGARTNAYREVLFI